MGSSSSFGSFSNSALAAALAVSTSTTTYWPASSLAADPAYEAEKKRIQALKDVKRATLGPKRSRWSA